MKIAVGSKNPGKIEAVTKAFKALWPHEVFDIIGVSVESGVSNQPKSDSESIIGAKNRAKAAIDNLQADYGVGLEGGMQEVDGSWFTSGWIAIVDRQGKIGVGSSLSMNIPPSLVSHIEAGKELGVATPVIADSLQFRIDSTTNPSYVGKVVSMLRFMFGGHDVKA